jgi:putative transposase
MIDPQHPQLSVRKQCELVGVNRNRLAPREKSPTSEDHEIMKILDVLYMKWPFLGARKLRLELTAYGWKIGRKRVRRLMRIMGIEALVPKPSLSIPDKKHKIYPYLLRHLEIAQADQVWCADITYLPMEKGHAYLVAIMDWKTRAVLAWEVSNTMDSTFCVKALRGAMRATGRKPAIFNTDQGSQFTGQDWIIELEKNNIRISMDGKGRWMDNVFIERLWRSLKYEQIRLHSYDTVRELKSHVAEWMHYYNHHRKHQHLDYQTPWSLYEAPTTALPEVA